MAILVAFSLATQRGFGTLTNGFDISQYRQIANSLYVTIIVRTLVMVIFAFNKPSAPALAAFHGSNICSIPPAQIGNITVWNGFISCWFSSGLHDPTYLPAIVVSLQIAALASIISTLLGLGAAVILRRSRVQAAPGQEQARGLDAALGLR